MKRIIYQALPRLWRNGRFSGWDTAAFAYLKSLGIDILWLTGVPRHASGTQYTKGDPGCPYAIWDWMDINPYLADDPDNRLDEFRQLTKRAHEAGIKIFTDFIPNHVARGYEGPIPVYEHYDYDWSDTQKVNYTDPRTEGEMAKVLNFWAGLGVDGFRCDMVELVDACILGRIISNAKRSYPELQFMAEVYQKDNYRRYLNEGGFDLLYDKSGVYDILRAICDGKASARELTWHWQWLSDIQPRMLNFLENHDEQRVCSPWWLSNGYPWAAAAYAALFNDSSLMLYFGQETGEDAAEGHEGRTSIFNWCEPAGIVAIDSLISSGKGMSRHQRSMLASYRRLMHLASMQVFRSGSNWDLAYCQGSGFDQDRHSAFLRYNEKECWLVACNYSDTDAVINIQLPDEFRQRIGDKDYSICVAPNNYVAIKL